MGFLPFFRFYYEEYFPNIKNKVPLQVSSGWYIDEAELSATLDARRLLKEFEIAADDTLFHPHADFYGIIGLLNALRDWPVERRPRLLLRFIGVMENASHAFRDPLAELIGRLNRAKADGLEMSFSAETPRYADMLAEKLSAVVTVTAYPEMSQPMPLAPYGPFTFYSPGSARLDKGFLLLPEILLAVRREDPDLQIRFVTQMLPPAEINAHMNVARQLYAMPGVQVQASGISSAEMVETYQRSHAVLLPYDTETYRYRGSAVLMEAAFHGRQAVTLDGSAFADIVKHYNLGRVVKDTEEMVYAVIEMARTDRSILEVRAAQARHRFHLDNTAAFENWLTIQ